MAQWKQILKSLGLTDSEITVYLLSLELGPVPVQEIARKAGVSRMTTYTAIESLTTRGLMSSLQKGKKMLYTAENPERLVSFVQNKITEVESTKREIEAALGELQLKQRGEKPVVKLLEGMEGLKTYLEDVVATKPDNTCELFNVETLGEVFGPEELRPLRTTMSKLNVHGRALHFGPLRIPSRKEVDSRLITHPHKKFGGDIFIYGNKIAFSTLRGKIITVIIESQEIADTVQALFDLAWNNEPKN
jgi:sugar-specific transcriptional regulator TrmB